MLTGASDTDYIIAGLRSLDRKVWDSNGAFIGDNNRVNHRLDSIKGRGTNHCLTINTKEREIKLTSSGKSEKFEVKACFFRCSAVRIGCLPLSVPPHWSGSSSMLADTKSDLGSVQLVLIARTQPMAGVSRLLSRLKMLLSFCAAFWAGTERVPSSASRTEDLVW